MLQALHDKQDLIYQEMMSHPALFMHPHPERVAIFKDKTGAILSEILKHETVKKVFHFGESVHFIPCDPVTILQLNEHDMDWPGQCDGLDIIIHATEPTASACEKYYAALDTQGVAVFKSTSPFDLPLLKQHMDQLKSAGFVDCQLFHFPSSMGWTSALMGSKDKSFKRAREQAIFMRKFKTFYYNLDSHKSAFVRPEFLRDSALF